MVARHWVLCFTSWLMEFRACYPQASTLIYCFQLMECKETVGAGKTLWPPSLARLTEGGHSIMWEAPSLYLEWGEEHPYHSRWKASHPTGLAKSPSYCIQLILFTETCVLCKVTSVVSDSLQPCGLQFMGSQRVSHDLMTEQQLLLRY